MRDRLIDHAVCPVASSSECHHASNRQQDCAASALCAVLDVIRLRAAEVAGAPKTSPLAAAQRAPAKCLAHGCYIAAHCGAYGPEDQCWPQAHVQRGALCASATGAGRLSPVGYSAEISGFARLRPPWGGGAQAGTLGGAREGRGRRQNRRRASERASPLAKRKKKPQRAKLSVYRAIWRRG